MTTLREAAQRALEAWQTATYGHPSHHKATLLAMTALRAALAEPVQEPVAWDWLQKWANYDDGEPETQWHEGYEAARRVVQIHLSAPPQRKPLAGVDLRALYDRHAAYQEEGPEASGWWGFARAIERAHGIGGDE